MSNLYIGNILGVNTTQTELEYTVYNMTKNIIIRINNKPNKMYIRIKLNIDDTKCMCNLIYYYTFRYFSNKMNNIHLYDMDLLPMDKCDVTNLCNVHITNWMEYMDIPL